MASTGDYDTNFHTVATVGALPNYAVPVRRADPQRLLRPLRPAEHQRRPVRGDPRHTVVPGSQVAITDGGILANQFPGMNPSTANPHIFIETSTQANTQNDDVALATNLTYHFPTFDVTYTGGYQSFYYNLFFGPGTDSGLAAYQIQGATARPDASTANLTHRSRAAGDQPAGHARSSRTTRYFSHELTFTSTDSGSVPVDRRRLLVP